MPRGLYPILKTGGGGNASMNRGHHKYYVPNARRTIDIKSEPKRGLNHTPEVV